MAIPGTMPLWNLSISADYKAVFRRKTRKNWPDICARDPEGAAEALHFLRTMPEQRIPGKVKKLKGKLKGLLQYYDVNYRDRVQYWVDKENEYERHRSS